MFFFTSEVIDHERKIYHLKNTVQANSRDNINRMITITDEIYSLILINGDLKCDRIAVITLSGFHCLVKLNCSNHWKCGKGENTRIDRPSERYFNFKAMQNWKFSVNALSK